MEQHLLARLVECICPSMALCSIREGGGGCLSWDSASQDYKGYWDRRGYYTVDTENSNQKVLWGFCLRWRCCSSFIICWCHPRASFHHPIFYLENLYCTSLKKKIDHFCFLNCLEDGTLNFISFAVSLVKLLSCKHFRHRWQVLDGLPVSWINIKLVLMLWLMHLKYRRVSNDLH